MGLEISFIVLSICLILSFWLDGWPGFAGAVFGLILFLVVFSAFFLGKS
jgi:hypothetical protein